MNLPAGALALGGRSLSAEDAGGKGAALSRLIVDGLPVPPTAVVTTESYRRIASDPDVAALISAIRAGAVVTVEEVDETFVSASVDADLAAEVTSVAAALGGRLAVRSSATVEDLATSSFAGQYRSLLNVDASDSDAVMSAVRMVWASLWHPAPCAYRRALGVADAAASMAVVLMQMVPAQHAGVVFTADPGGTRDNARIEAVAGLGEALVSGAATPEAWVLPRDGIGDAEVPGHVAEALRLSLDIEASSGRAQDVEWAWDGTRLWIVQARPITTHAHRDDGFDTVVDDHELTTAGIGEMVPGVLPPLRWQVNAHLLEDGFRRLLAELDVEHDAAVDPAPLIRRVRGQAALDFHQLRAVAAALPGGEVEELEAQYFGTGPPSRIDSAGRGVRDWFHDLRVTAARRRAVENSAVVVAAVDRMATRWPELPGRRSEELLVYRQRLIDLAARGTAAEIAVAAAAAASYRRLEVLIEKHLGPSEAARHAQATTAGAGAVAAPPLDACAAVFAGPTWRELGREPLELPAGDERRQVAQDELDDRLTSKPGWRITRVLTGQVIDLRVHMIHRAIADSVDLLQLRERTKATLMIIGGETRRVLHEVARRLLDDGKLDDVDDIELFVERELRAAVAGRSPVSRIELTRRRNCVERYERMGSLPVRFTGVPDAVTQPLPDGDRIVGWASSAGRRTGRARVVDRPTGSLERGEVLVAAATDASWSPLFAKAGAIVVERGGPLSHAAILARELGLPAVLNAVGATQLLDGRRVTVDGDLGTVVVLDDDASGSSALDDRAPVGADSPLGVTEEVG